uniref:SMP-30/gluconolactonase/LRE family protein n=1 Tax=Mesocestoides corti TaxID=53468 RepID=A0A5K3G0G3_MESCO
SGLEGRIAWYPSLVVYNERLLLSGCEQEVLELAASPDSPNSTLDGCMWKPAFSIQGQPTGLMVLRKSH